MPSATRLKHVLTSTMVTGFHGTNAGAVTRIMKHGLGIDLAYYREMIVDPIADLLAVNPVKLFKLTFKPADTADHLEYEGQVSHWQSLEQCTTGSGLHYLVNVSAKGGEFKRHTIDRVFKTACRLAKTRYNNPEVSQLRATFVHDLIGDTRPVVIESRFPISLVVNPKVLGTTMELVTKAIHPRFIVAVHTI